MGRQKNRMGDVHRRHESEEGRHSVDAMTQILAMYVFRMPTWATKTF